MQGLVVRKDDPRVSKTIKRLKQLKLSQRALQSTRKVHTCKPQTCNPQNELDFIRQGLLKQQPFTSNVYLCNYGVIHVCNPDDCTLYAGNFQRTCPISGLNVGVNTSSYSSQNQKSWYAKDNASYGYKETTQHIQEQHVTFNREDLFGQAGDGARLLKREHKKAKRIQRQQEEEEKEKEKAVPVSTATTTAKLAALAAKRNRNPKIKQAKQRAEELVRLLLFSNRRTSVNQKAAEENQAHSDNAKLTLFANCQRNRNLPYLSDIIRTENNCTTKALPLVIFQASDETESLVTYFVDVVCAVWKMALAHYVSLEYKEYDLETGTEILPRLDFDGIVIFTLYSMRSGFYVRGKHDEMVEAIPHSDFLMAHLPLIPHLHHFGIDRSKHTNGEKIVVTAYDNAIKHGLSNMQIKINIDDLSMQDVLIENGKEVPVGPVLNPLTSRNPESRFYVGNAPSKKR